MALTIIAKNVTLSPLPVTNLSVTDSAIPASGQVTLTDTNSVPDIQCDPQILSYLISGDVVLNDGVVDLTLAQAQNFLSAVAISTPPVNVGDMLAWNGDAWAAAPAAPALLASGIVTLDGAGQFVVLHPLVAVGSRFTLTTQDGGTAMTGCVQVVSRSLGASFTIASSAGGADAGAVVYWQHWPGI